MTREERREEQKRRLKILFHRWNIEEYREAPDIIAFSSAILEKVITVCIAFPTDENNFIRISFCYGINEIDDAVFSDERFNYALSYLEGIEESYNFARILAEDKEKR